MAIWYTAVKWVFTLVYAIAFVAFMITNLDFWIYINLVSAAFMFVSWFYEWYYCN